MIIEPLTDPIDPVHAEAVRVQKRIRKVFQALRDQVATWEPREMPETFQRAR